MFNKNKKFYITTTLPYVNADPHIGFALEIIQADVLARYYRNLGYDTFFNTGVDEHGLKIFRKAQESNMDPQQYCDIYAEKFDNLKQALNLSYNSFVRTTNSHHIKAAQHFWTLCDKNGDIYKKNYKIKYCVGCELEKTDSELTKGRCPIHPNQEMEIFEEENYFFRYSKYQNKLLDFYQKNPKFVLPDSRFNEIKEFTKRGLEDFSISRLKEKMSWGVPVPNDDKQVMFVWFEALVSYVSALGWPNSKKFNDFWPGFQMAGKDNLRQQSSMWQAMLMSADLLPSKQIFIHGFITIGSQKISKSLGNVIDPFKLVKKYGADAVRYYLLREISPTEDGDFTYEKFEARYNSDLAAGIGNLVSRVITLAAKSISKSHLTPAGGFPVGFIPNPKFTPTPNFGVGARIQNPKLKKAIEEAKKNCAGALEKFKFNEALKIIWELIAWCDKYINDERPWEEKENAGQVISDLLFALQNIADLLAPFLPETAEKIKKTVKEKKSAVLFPRI